MVSFGDRVRVAAESVGGLNALAERIGMPRRTLGDQISSKGDPKLSFLAAVSGATGKPIAWLAGEMDEAPDTRGGAIVGGHNLLPIPVFAEVRPSAGGGSLPASEQVTSVMAFDQKWLRDLGVNPIYAKILFAEGDSMYPTIPNGSPMLVDTSRTEIMNGCIYVFNVDGDLMVKRIERLLDGTIDLISDNKERYPTRNITRDRLRQMTIVGRVYSALRTF